MSEEQTVKQVPIPEDALSGHTTLAREIAHKKALAHFHELIARVHERKAALAKAAKDVSAWAKHGRLSIDNQFESVLASRYASGNNREWVVAPEHWEAFGALVAQEGLEMGMRISLDGEDDEEADEAEESDADADGEGEGQP